MKTNRSHAFAPLFTTGCLSLLFAMVLLAPQARAAVVISDDFTGVNGTDINGRSTQVGGVTWTSFRPAGGIAEIQNNGVTVSTTTAGYFSVPFSVGTDSSFEIDTNVWPHGNNLNLTFATTSTASQGSAQMTVWGAINSFGGWSLNLGGTGIASGGGLTLGSTSYGDAVLAYNVTTSTLSFKVNNVVLYSGTQTISVGSITTAGISYNNISNDNTNPEVTAFSVVAVPEPSSMALGFVGMGLMVLAVRRRIRA